MKKGVVIVLVAAVSVVVIPALWRYTEEPGKVKDTEPIKEFEPGKDEDTEPIKEPGSAETKEDTPDEPDIADTVSITIVYDNFLYNPGLQKGWGFSCVVKGTEKTILFDTEEDGTVLLSNMDVLGIHPKDIDVVVLSRIHRDHTGGLFTFLKENNDVTLYVLQSFPGSFKQKAVQYGATAVEVSTPVNICQAVYSTGEMGSVKEQSLLIKTKNGVIVITGCAHPGVVNIIKRQKQCVQMMFCLSLVGSI